MGVGGTWENSQVEVPVGYRIDVPSPVHSQTLVVSGALLTSWHDVDDNGGAVNVDVGVVV